MTAVILAKDYAAAYDVAQRLGFGQDWVYPHDPTLLNGLHVTRLVYVHGWMQSGAITTTAMEMLPSRTTELTEVTQVLESGDIVDTTRFRRPLVTSPADAAPTPEPVAPSTPPRARRGTPPWLTLVGGGLVGATIALVGQLAGWW